MICRVWRGWTAGGDADAYAAYLTEELYPRLARELAGRGYRGFHVIRRADGDEVVFVTMTWFDSIESVQAFAGSEYETPVITRNAAALLSHHDDRVLHYELVDEWFVEPGDTGGGRS
jgi:antibiotic biosynthesis monooxygenase (ABM) superfamily enzyme